MASRGPTQTARSTPAATWSAPPAGRGSNACGVFGRSIMRLRTDSPLLPGKPLTACRVCGHGSPHLVLNLGRQPLANRYLTAAQLGEPEPTAPLGLLRCGQCGFLQLSYVI